MKSIVRSVVSYSLVAIAIALVYVDISYAAITATEFKNPLGIKSIAELVSTFLKVMVLVALPIISLYVVYSGYLFIAARGNPEKLGDAKANFLYVIIGSVFILGAWVFASIIGGTIVEITK